MTTQDPHNQQAATPRMSRVTHATLAFTVAGVAVLSGCTGGQKKASGPPPVPVTTAVAVRKTVPVSVRAIGHVEPIATVAVKARIGGELSQVHFTEGQNVRAGETLFTIDPRQYAAELRQAEAQLARDQALAKKAEADVARYRDLVAKDFVTKEQYDQIVATAGSARASVEADQANVDNARLQLAYCTITSPIAGRTGNLSVKVGNLIKANDDHGLVTINQIKPINVVVHCAGAAPAADWQERGPAPPSPCRLAGRGEGRGRHADLRRQRCGPGHRARSSSRRRSPTRASDYGRASSSM